MRILTLVALCSAVSLPAAAAPITYSFTGTVRQIGSSGPQQAAVGQQVPIVITLAANAQASQLPKQPGSYSNFTPFLISSATFAGEDYAGGLFQTITVLPTSSIQFHVVGLQTSFGFDLLLSGAAPGALPNGDLPLTIDPSRFAQGTFSVIGAFSPSFIGYSGTIDVAPVPEPATVMIMLGGVLAVCAARRKPVQVRDPEEL